MRPLSEFSFLLVLIFIAAVLTLYIFWPFMMPLVLGIIFAVVLQPLYRRLLALLGGRESIASLLTLLIAVALLIIPFVFLGVQLLREAQGAYGAIAFDNVRAYPAQWQVRAQPWIDQYMPDASEMITQFTSNIDIYARQGLSWLAQHVGAAFSGITTFFLQTFIFLMTLYYLLRDGARLKRFVIALSPLQDSDDEMILDKLELAVNSVVKGKLLISLIQGVLSGIGFALFGIPNPVLWGLVAAIASMVPPLGTALVLVPAVGYLFIIGAITPAIGLALWSVLAVGLIDNMLGPKLIGRGMRLHPLLVLLSVLGGLAFFGPVGLFIGPLLVSLLVTLLSLYSQLRQSN